MPLAIIHDSRWLLCLWLRHYVLICLLIWPLKLHMQMHSLSCTEILLYITCSHKHSAHLSIHEYTPLWRWKHGKIFARCFAFHTMISVKDFQMMSHSRTSWFQIIVPRLLYGYWLFQYFKNWTSLVWTHAGRNEAGSFGKCSTSHQNNSVLTDDPVPKVILEAQLRFGIGSSPAQAHFE